MGDRKSTPRWAFFLATQLINISESLEAKAEATMAQLIAWASPWGAVPIPVVPRRSADGFLGRV